MDSMDLEESPASATDAELSGALRDGRALLKEETEPAFRRSLELFEKALTLARMVGDTTQTRRATRGLARAAVAGTTPGRERHANASARTAWEDAIVVMARR